MGTLGFVALGANDGLAVGVLVTKPDTAEGTERVVIRCVSPADVLILMVVSAWILPTHTGRSSETRKRAHLD